MRYLIILILFLSYENSMAQNSVLVQGMIKEVSTKTLGTSLEQIVMTSKLYDDTLEFQLKNSSDTILLFSTSFADDILLYDASTLQFHKKEAILNLGYQVPHEGSYYSGLNQYQFTKLVPNEILTIRIDMKRLLENSNKCFIYLKVITNIFY